MEMVMEKSKVKKKKREKPKDTSSVPTAAVAGSSVSALCIDEPAVDSCEEPAEIIQACASEELPLENPINQGENSIDRVADQSDGLAEAVKTLITEKASSTLVEDRSTISETAYKPSTKSEESSKCFNDILNMNKNLALQIRNEEMVDNKGYEKAVTRATCRLIKPYTEGQLASFYTNTELEMLDHFTAHYVEAELNGLACKQHPLFELLSSYLQVRGKITGNSLELEQLRKEYWDLQGMLWTTNTSSVVGRGECQDGSLVTAMHSYQKATFHRSVFQSLVRVLGHIRKLTYENHVLYSYTAEDLRLQIELYIQTTIGNCIGVTHLNKDAPVLLSLQEEPLHLKPYLSEIRICISVLFAFQRKILRDPKFVTETREWLSRLVAVLLRLATYQDHLFIVCHILRCPAGVGSWAASFIQSPLDENLQESPFSSYQINHILSVLDMILSPVRERDRFLEDLCQKDSSGELLWIVVDSDGEEDDESGTSLKENDLVALLSQLPLESLFRAVLLVERRNSANSYDLSKVSQHHILRFLAFGTIFLRIVKKGLITYSHSRYNQFSKRLSRFIRHIVQYATDQWELLKESQKMDDPAMVERLQVEYDSFFLRAIYYLYISQKLGAWQFLAVVPYHLITTRTAWRIFSFLHDSDSAARDIAGLPDDRDYRNKLWEASFRTQFEEKISTLADDELYYLLQTFANMALARKSEDADFVEAATKDLLQVGFVSLSTQEMCSKTARTLLTHLTSKYPQLLSSILKDVRDNMETIGSLALYLYEELPLTVWEVSNDDLEILSRLLSHSPTSSESKLARMILSRLNWDILPYDMHCDVALLVVKVVDEEPAYLQWGWQTILRLKLHINDKGFKDLTRVLSPDNYDIILKGIRQQQPLASFVAVLMTTWGHLIPLVISQGLSQLLFLQFHQKQEAVLFALYLIVPLFINSQEYIINDEKFQEIVTNLISADRGYISMAKSLISVQSTVLQQFGNMIETQIVNYANYDLDSPRFLVRLWINTLVSIPAWNRDNGIMYLLDVIVRAAFFHQDSLEVASSALREMLQSNLHNGQTNTISSIFKWVSNSTTSGSLIAGSLVNCSWLAYVIIDVEFEEKERRPGLWHELLIQLGNQKGKISVDGAIKKATSNLRLPAFPSGSLCLYRWAQQAMDTPVDHPLLPLLWQKFFTLYLTRISVASASDRGCVGDRFFDGLVNFNFLKRMKRKLQETLDFYQEKFSTSQLNNEDSGERKLYLESCVNIFKAFLLWLEEPMLQKNNLMLPSLPPVYQPNLLAFIIQGSTTPWFEYVDYAKVKTEQQECIRLWQISNFRLKTNINKPLPNPDSSVESPDPVQRILRRLSAYDKPKDPPAVKSTAPIVPVIDLSSKHSMFNSLDQCFKTLKQFAHNHNLKVSEHKALDCSYQELVPQLYRSVLNKVTKKVLCKGRNDVVRCSGAALIILEMQEARVNDRIDHQITSNRNAYESLLAQSSQVPALALCTASVTIQQVIKVLQLQVQCNPETATLGSELFYHILSLVSEETNTYLPTKTLFSSNLEKLGQSHICGVELEMPRLLDKILKEPAFGEYLAPHFSPSNIGSESLLLMYSKITQEIGSNYDVTFALLSKFDVENWLKVREPKLKDRSKFIQYVVKALTTLGYEPSIDALMLHCLYRKHLLNVFEFQFPEHYGEILVQLLKGNNGNSDSCLLSRSVWMDVLSFLSNPVVMNPKIPLREQFRQYAQHQKMLQHQELLETAELLASHFTRERLQYGLYGLYPKCRNYVDVFAILLGMTGHGLIISMVNMHQGLLGDKLCQKIWPLLTNLFAPWIVPYSMQNLKDNMASWIQQLADDRSILLPWIPADVALAQKVIQVFFECVQFLIHALPASFAILNYIWQWYVTCFAHASVKDHILSPIHHCFSAFPWGNFWPSVGDLELMVRVVDQYLPECHSFLGHVFISVSWTSWLDNFKTSPPQMKNRVYNCFINLLVKLCNEPNIRDRHPERVKVLLVEAENYDWGILEPATFHHVMDWYIMSCDSNVIFKSDPLNLDYRVLQFLKTVSGYNKPLENTTSEATSKRLIFVKSYVKLVLVYVNRHKALLPNKETELKSVITQQLQQAESVVHVQEEMNAVLSELLGFVNIQNLNKISVNCCFERWISTKLGDGIVVRAILQVLGISVTDSESVAAILELTIDTYFRNNVSEGFVPTWKELTEILHVSASKQTVLEQTMVTRGSILALNALFLQRISKCNDRESLLNLALHWVSSIKICANVQPKVPLLWFGILKLCHDHCERDEHGAGAILYKFAKILLQFSEEKGGSRWGRGLLNVIGIAKDDAASMEFLSRALAGYILAQLPEMKGEPQVVRRQPNAPAKVGEPRGNSECAKVLMNLGFGQSQGKIKECEELALRQIQDAENSMHNVSKFLSLLLKQFYTQPYLKDVG